MEQLVNTRNDETDEVLMARVPREREVFGVLIERYEARLRRYLKRFMPGLAEEVDDVLQEVFIKAYVNAHGFDPALSFSSWVYRIAHNEAVTWLRKRTTRPETVELGDDECTTFLASMEAARDTNETSLTKDAVARALAGMSEKYRTVLVLRFLEEKSYEEIGDILEVPGGTVATFVHRAKKEFSRTYATHHAR